MLTLSLALLLLLASAGFVLLRPRVEPASPARKSENPHAAVELVTGPASCPKAARLSGRRQLAAQAPALPMEGCTVRCRCAYKRYADRRHMNRRRTDDGLPDNFIWAGELKRQRDRRAV